MAAHGHIFICTHKCIEFPVLLYCWLLSRPESLPPCSTNLSLPHRLIKRRQSIYCSSAWVLSGLTPTPSSWPSYLSRLHDAYLSLPGWLRVGLAYGLASESDAWPHWVSTASNENKQAVLLKETRVLHLRSESWKRSCLGLLEVMLKYLTIYNQTSAVHSVKN